MSGAVISLPRTPLRRAQGNFNVVNNYKRPRLYKVFARVTDISSSVVHMPYSCIYKYSTCVFH
jgi:hypothetical protein